MLYPNLGMQLAPSATLDPESILAGQLITNITPTTKSRKQTSIFQLQRPLSARTLST